MMTAKDIIERYNYDSFTSDNFMPWMRFDKSPVLGEPAPDFPLSTLEEKETSLSEVWGANVFTVVEFGSFT